jgi:translation elongation factor EF-Tu-like GTPase
VKQNGKIRLMELMDAVVCIYSIPPRENQSLSLCLLKSVLNHPAVVLVLTGRIETGVVNTGDRT